jgi:hypothetical protein
MYELLHVGFVLLMKLISQIWNSNSRKVIRRTGDIHVRIIDLLL